jgi:hypothetical protein
VTGADALFTMSGANAAISGNRATGGGGGLYQNNGEFYMFKGVMQSNIAATGGRALSIGLPIGQRYLGLIRRYI